MPSTKIVLNVHGGVVQDVFCSDSTADVRIVDWDINSSDEDSPGVVEVVDEHGRTSRAFVGGILANPLMHLAGTDVERALAAAEAVDAGA